MPALMAKRSSSERCAIRRELHRRRKLAAVAKGGIVKQSSAQQSSASASIHKSSADEPAGPATTKSSSTPTPRPRAGGATSIPQHAPAAVATKKQLAAVAKGGGGVAKEISYVPMGQITKRCTAPPRRSALTPTAPSMKVSAVKRVSGVPSKSSSPPPPCRSTTIPPASSGADTTELSATTGAEYIKNMPTRSRSCSISAKKGMKVKVRTRAGILPTGQCLLLWLGALVVSSDAADDGSLEVIYDGNFPRDDPLRTVRVAMDDVRSMPTIGES